MTALRVRSLFVYPVKSCRGIAVESARLVERGFELDRRWMIADERGRFLTQRELPRLALIGTRLAGDAIVLCAPGVGELELPVVAPSSAPRMRVRVWSDQGDAQVYRPASEWLGAFLGQPARAVYMPDDVRRPVSRAPDAIVGFADAYPLLCVGHASLEALNRRLAQPIGMERFRPNLVVAGGEPHAEDTWQSLEVGEVALEAAKLCDRCAVVTVDPATGERGREPLATLAEYRRHEGAVWFGVNLLHRGRGVLRVGDPVVVHGRRASPFD